MDVHLTSRLLFYADSRTDTIYQLSLKNYKDLGVFASGNIFSNVLAVDNVNE